MEFTIYIPEMSDRNQFNAPATAISSNKPQHSPQEFWQTRQTMILEILMRLA